MSRIKHSDEQESRGSEVSAFFKRSKSVWHLLFHVGIFIWLLYLFHHISVSSIILVLVSLCIVCLWGVSFMSYIVLKMGRGWSLKITFFWKNNFGSGYINYPPTPFGFQKHLLVQSCVERTAFYDKNYFLNWIHFKLLPNDVFFSFTISGTG